MSDSTSVSVEIFGQRYPIRSTLDADYVNRLAHYVDGKIRAAGDAAPGSEPVRVAVLAALNIADEYHLLRKRSDGGSSGYQQRAHKLANALDKVLEDGRAG